MNKRTALTTTVLTVALALAPMTAAQAARKPLVNFSGLGIYAVSGSGTASATGTVSGTPFDGRFTAALQPLDGTLPEPGVCEAGHASIRIDGARGRYAVLIGNGSVCGEYLDATNVVTHAFTGTYSVASTSERKLQLGDGSMDIRLTVDGRSAVSAYDS
jgi:hypothetical protein